MAGAHVHHHGGGAGDLVLHVRVIVAAGQALCAGLAPVLDEHVLHAVCQDALHLLLQGDVDGQVDVVAGDRLLEIDGAEHGAGGVAGLHHFPVLAVELLLKGVLDAVLAHVGVGGVVHQGIALELLLGHQARVAQQMGRVLRAVFPDVGPLDLDAGELVLHDGGDQRHAGVLDEHVVGGVDGVAHVDGIAHARDDAHLLGGVAVVDVIAGAHVAQQLHGAGVLGHGAAPGVGQIGVQHGLLDVGHVGGVLEGRGPGDGQVVGVLVAVALHHAHQLQDDGVGIVVFEELDVVDLQVIAFLVADQHPAVAVQDVAAGRGDHLFFVGDLLALVIVLLSLYDLEIVEEGQIDDQDDGEDDAHGQYPAGLDGSVHCNPFLIGSPSGGAGASAPEGV